MTTKHPHIQRGGAARRISIVAAAAVAATFGLAYAGALAETPGAAFATLRQDGRSGSAGSVGFGWPVKPFDREHPVRGTFGDPRMIFREPPTLAGLMHGSVAASFHQGVDVSAPNGTAVYPVLSGVVTDVRPGRVCVDAGGGRTFEYWHIAPQVHAGEHVDARETVLGRILAPQHHVHLTVVENGRVVNPLASGRLGPYTDTTTPRVTSITFRRTDAGPELLPNFLRGRVAMLVSAYDLPTIPAPGIWEDMPTTPALLTWRIQRPNGKVAVRERVAYDHRSTEPANYAFWSTYARGTFQNMAVFGKHYSYMQAGRFVFRLTPRAFDTHALRDGVYELVVTATDIRGNHGSLALRFTVHNRPGWVGSGS